MPLRELGAVFVYRKLTLCKGKLVSLHTKKEITFFNCSWVDESKRKWKGMDLVKEDITCKAKKMMASF